MWEVVKDRMMLNQPVVPEDDGIGLPLHSDLRRNAGADGVKKKPNGQYEYSRPTNDLKTDPLSLTKCALYSIKPWGLCHIN